MRSFFMPVYVPLYLKQALAISTEFIPNQPLTQMQQALTAINSSKPQRINSTID